jgi:hypothetical protein
MTTTIVKLVVIELVWLVGPNHLDMLGSNLGEVLCYNAKIGCHFRVNAFIIKCWFSFSTACYDHFLNILEVLFVS